MIIMDRNENFEVTKVYYSQIPKSSLLKKKSKLRVLLLSLFRKLHTYSFFRKELNRKNLKIKRMEIQNLPRVEQQAVVDSRTKNAILTKRNGSTIPSTSATGSKVRLGIRRLNAVVDFAVSGDPFPASELDIVSRFIPFVDM